MSSPRRRALLRPGRRSALAVVAAVMIIGCAPERNEETGELAEPGDLGVFDLKVGDCLAEFTDGAELSSIEAAPCSEPHSDEIYAEGTVPDVDEFPGTKAVEAAAQDICLADYEAFVGRSYDRSVLDIGYLTPTEDSWADGDRAVLCTIFDPLEEVTGSLRGSER
jgi:hypothetical protein